MEKLSKTCSGDTATLPNLPFDVVLPFGAALPKGDSAKVVAYNDEEFGFLRLTVDINERVVIGQFFAAYDQSNPSAALPALRTPSRSTCKNILLIKTALPHQNRRCSESATLQIDC